jgi:excisionase family DNA binding protein
VDDKILLRPEEAAQRLGVSRSVVYELIAEGRIESIRIGKSRRIPVEALLAFVEAQRQSQHVAVLA